MEFLNGINAVTLLLAALGIFAIGYRFYGLYLANNLLRLQADRATPAVKYNDNKDFVPTNKYVLFGHHFAAIAAAGPLLGPILASQFGFLPGALWIIFGTVFAGAVHDMVVLFASVRHRGRSLASIAHAEIDPVTGMVASIGILCILILTLAGLSLALVNAMQSSPWGTFTIVATVPIAMIMGLYMHQWRAGDVKGGSLIGVVLLFFTILAGPYVVASDSLNAVFNWSPDVVKIALVVYGIVASILPVWLLLLPRDYLSSYLKIGTIIALAIGILCVWPQIQMPALTDFIGGGGPIIGGPVLPFVMITIACGAISGFHAIIATGTTPKMVGSEPEILFVGYGAMVMEGFVAIMALIAACTLVPADYFAINTSQAAWDALATTHPAFTQTVDLERLAAGVQENVMHRPGGAVSLAVGMAHIFSSIPFMDSLMAYWYHFAIMFEAVFILTAIDAGTRVGRFFLQEFIGKFIPQFDDKSWWPGVVTTSIIFTLSWGYLVWTGDISSIWPLFGICNQLLAACGLIVATTLLMRLNRGKLVLTTAIPGIIMALVTFWAGYLQVTGTYYPKGQTVLWVLACLVMVLMLFIFIGAFRRWSVLMSIKDTQKDAYGDDVLAIAEE
ncbi:MAG: carbon starvation protein A [Methylobacteriaceae bacterium]|nr:carbon starvation protein A [Methylobacteriaceae bacterium]